MFYRVFSKQQTDSYSDVIYLKKKLNVQNLQCKQNYCNYNSIPYNSYLGSIKENIKECNLKNICYASPTNIIEGKTSYICNDNIENYFCKSPKTLYPYGLYFCDNNCTNYITDISDSLNEEPPTSSELQPTSSELPPNSSDLSLGLTELPPGLTELPPGLTELPPGLTELPPGLTELPPNLSCDPHSHPCDPHSHPCDPHSHPCDPHSHPCDPHSHPCDPHSHPCHLPEPPIKIVGIHKIAPRQGVNYLGVIITRNIRKK